MALFNRGDHWGSHEAWEAAWHLVSGEDRALCQGLILAAAGLHKLRIQGNPRGAHRLLSRALTRLDPLPGEVHGIALAAFRAQLRQWHERLADGEREAGVGLATFDAPLRGLPRIAWSAAAGRARLRVESLWVHPVAVDGRKALILELRSGEHRGWAECPMPWRLQGTRASIERVLGPALLAEPVAAPSALPLRWRGLAEDPFAAAALEMATWDLWSHREGWSLEEALGILPRPVPLAATAHGVGAAALKAEVERILGDGYALVVLPARPGADRRLLPRIVRGLPGSFAFDLKRAYRPADLYALRVLAGCGPTALLRPVPSTRLHESARLCRWLEVPVVAESPRDHGEGESLVALGATDELLVDPLRCGPSEGLVLAELAEARGVPSRIRAHPVTPLGARAALALAAHEAFSRPADVGRGPSAEGGAPAGLSRAWPCPDGHGVWSADGAPSSSDRRDGPVWLEAVRDGPSSRLRI